MKLTTCSLSLLTAALLAGCAAGPATTKSDAPAAAGATDGAKAVESRAQQRWDLLIAAKPAEAYDFLSPGYREVKKREDYAAELSVRPVRWTKAEVKGTVCPSPGEICDVTIEIYYNLDSNLPGVGKLESQSPVEERWIMTDGNWYFVPKEVARK